MHSTKCQQLTTVNIQLFQFALSARFLIEDTRTMKTHHLPKLPLN